MKQSLVATHTHTQPPALAFCTRVLSGDGKSIGTHWLLRRLRLAGKTVVWQRKSALHVLLLRQDGTAWRGTLMDFVDELLSPDTWWACWL